ncbi:MAG: hypothetical protein Q9187_001228 [Circinaria calcarea]
MHTQLLKRKHVKYVPEDILLKILQYTNVGDMHKVIRTLSPDLCNSEGSKLIDSALNIRAYLSAVTDFPDALATIMMHTDVILSGSIALNYFVPGSAIESSDLDFVSGMNNDLSEVFMTATTRIGFIWCTRARYNDKYAQGAAHKVHTGRVKAHGKTYNIHMISSVFDTAYDHVMQHDLSIVRCFISASCAVSVHHSTTSKMVYWIDRHPNLSTCTRMAKYESRGFKFLPTHRKCSSRLIKRNIIDASSMIITFEKYLNVFDDDNSCLSTIAKLREFVSDCQSCNKSRHSPTSVHLQNSFVSDLLGYDMAGVVNYGKVLRAYEKTWRYRISSVVLNSIERWAQRFTELNKMTSHETNAQKTTAVCNTYIAYDEDPTREDVIPRIRASEDDIASLRLIELLEDFSYFGRRR